MIDLTTVSREDVIRQWVDALRSGKYEQGKIALRHANGTYCCLGVLCDVVGVDWQPAVNGQHNDVYAAVIEGSLPDYQYLPTGIAEALGVLRDGYGFVDDARPLSMLNDSYDWTFDQIADAVEEHAFGTANPA